MNKKLLSFLLIGLGCFVFISLMLNFGILSSFNTKITDSFYGGKTPMNNIVIIAIDDKSIQELGRWPWDRTRFSELVDKLHSARAVGIDVAFFEKSNDDESFINSIKNTNNVFLTAEYTSFLKQNGTIYGRNILLPIGDLSKSRLGYVNILTDNDGVTRAVNMQVNGNYKSLTEEVYKLYLGKDFSNPSQRFLINFIGKPGTFTTYSFSDVLKSNISFKDKIVFVGATSPDLHDDYFVPTSKGKAMPGVEIHANTLQTMLTKNYLNEESQSAILITLFIICFGLSLLVYRYGMFIPTIISAIAFISYIVFSIVVFNLGIIANVIYPVIGVVITYISSVAYSYLSEKKSKFELKNAFSKYVSPLLVNEIMKNPDKLKLGGEKRNITIMFSDIRGFTTISEALGPEKLVHFLNEYLTEMTNIVLKNKGVVDKFIGDAVMAFWGAPLSEKKQEYLSCKASVEMILKLIELRKGWSHLPYIDIGIGLNEGECVVGNMGSNDRFDYTAIGDPVNLASRLEGLNKQYGTNIIVSENVYEKVSKDFTFRELDFVKVKGKTKPVKIYELVIDGKKDNIKVYENGLNKYVSKDFEGALKEFSKLNDKASKMFVERCKFLIKNPPKQWDGSFEFKTK